MDPNATLASILDDMASLDERRLEPHDERLERENIAERLIDLGEWIAIARGFMPDITTTTENRGGRRVVKTEIHV